MKNPDEKRILVLDDQTVILQAISKILRGSKEPFVISLTSNGNDALKKIEEKLPDLIITDWEMPEMSGIEFIKHLKNNNHTKDIPVIMCTGAMMSSKNLETALEAGAVDYIRKPIDKVELIARTKANLHLAENYKKIKNLNELKDNILSIISHDLRDPLGNIKTFMKLILEKRSVYDQDKIMKIINEVEKQSTSVYNILENLLMWANNLRKNIVFQPEYQEINIAVNNSIELLKSLAEKKMISILNRIGDDIYANYDNALISAVIRNLLANAIKYTARNGLITIDAEKNQTEIVISVSDTGVGIHPERKDKIFDKTIFNTTYGTNKERGSGLGLKICMDFIERHDGRIWVESEVNKGSRFKFTLPVASI